MGAGKRKFLSRPVIAATVLLGLLIALGGVRSYSSHLEALLGGLNREIEARSQEEMELWQLFSSLTSPIKVYSYCRDKLGMDNPKNVKVVRVPDSSRVAAAPDPNPRGWRSGVLSFFGFSMN
jgi:hypothetical protein